MIGQFPGDTVQNWAFLPIHNLWKTSGAIAVLLTTIYMLRQFRTNIMYKYTIKDTVDSLLFSLKNPIEGIITAFIFVLRTILPQQNKSVSAHSFQDYKDDTAYIHMFPRKFTKKVVNLSPYAIKVETWCRMNQVPYEIVETSKFSSKEHQIPYMVLNGVETPDSGAIINKLQEHYQIKSTELSPEQQGTERAVARMMDDNFAVFYFWYRYHQHRIAFSKCFSVTTAPRFLRSFIGKQMGKGLDQRAHLMGFSRYGEENTVKQGEADLKALENILREQTYIFGDKPSKLDATIFGHLTQILYPDMDYPWKTYIHDHCPNLHKYCDRIRSEFWPDWDSLVEHDTF